jgi:two-component system response regulator MprA
LISPTPSDESVLVVDDDDAIREVLTFILEHEHYTVIQAANGQEALDRLTEGAQPGLILLDLMMPAMSGWDFRERQAHDPVWGKIPVVVMTGDGNIESKSATLMASSYLKKPVELEDLLATVARYVRKREAD